MGIFDTITSVGDHHRVPGLNSGQHAAEQHQLEAHAQLLAQANIVLGQAAQQTADVASLLRTLVDLQSRPGSSNKPQIRRFDFNGTVPTSGRFELPAPIQDWQLDAVIAIAADLSSGTPQTPQFTIAGLLRSADVIGFAGTNAAVQRWQFGIPLYPVQELTLQATGSPAATVNHTVWLRYTPIGG